MKAHVLVRHARAGKRGEWKGDDRLRPLDKRGRRHAVDLVSELSGYQIERILSSPSLRCVQSVEPIAAERGIEVERRSELEEGASRAQVLALLDELEGTGAVLCTHGDVIEELLGQGMRKGEVRVISPRG